MPESKCLGSGQPLDQSPQVERRDGADGRYEHLAEAEDSDQLRENRHDGGSQAYHLQEPSQRSEEAGEGRQGGYSSRLV